MDYSDLDTHFSQLSIVLHDPVTNTAVNFSTLAQRMDDLSGLSHAEMHLVIPLFEMVLAVCDDEAAQQKLHYAVRDLGMRIAYR